MGFNPPSTLLLQVGTGEEQKITIYRYLLLFAAFAIFVVAYSPILAPTLIQIA